MTMDVYAQLERRADRSQAPSFDALLRGAKQRLTGADWATIGPRASKTSSHRLPNKESAAESDAACASKG
jgi:hypothetical protein